MAARRRAELPAPPALLGRRVPLGGARRLAAAWAAALLLPAVATAADVRYDILHVGVVDNATGGGGVSASAPVVRFGTPLALDRTSRFQALSHILERTYLLFFDWLNGERGGIFINGVAHRAELLLIGDRSDPDVSEEIARYLIQDLGIQLILGPFGSDSTATVARVVNNSNAVMLAPAASSTNIFSGRPRLFGMPTPANMFLHAAFGVLGTRVQSVAVVRESGGFPEQACSIVATAALDYSLTQQGTMVVALQPNTALGEVTPAAAVQQLADWKPDLVVACVYDEVCKETLRQMESQNFNPEMVVSTVCVTSPQFLEDLGDRGRWVMGAAPWVSNEKEVSNFSHMSAKAYADRYTEAYGEEPPYQGAATWGAAEALVAAVELAGSTDPTLVAQELANLNLMTVFGQTKFDINGQNTKPVTIVQHKMVDTRPRIVAPAELAVDEPMFPMPHWSERRCYAVTPRGSIYGFPPGSAHPAPNGTCSECSRSHAAVFLPAAGRRECGPCAINHVAFWIGPEEKICLFRCAPGYNVVSDPNSDGWLPLCAACPAGLYQDGAECIACDVGSFGATAAQSACELCPLGKFMTQVGSTECSDCPPGQAALEHGSTKCEVCHAGSHAPQSGSSICPLCESGRVAANEGASACQECQPGRFSAWGGIACEPCSRDTFQQAAGQGTCIKVPLGAVAPTEGMVLPLNARYYWTSRSYENSTASPDPDVVKMELCKFWPEACYQGERCEDGSYGRQCFSCAPGYSRKHGSCFPCTSRWLHAGATCVVLVLMTAIGLLVAYIVKDASLRPMDVHTILLKQLVNHLVMMSVAREVFDIIFADLSRSGDVDPDALLFGRGVAEFFDWGDGTSVLLPVETPIWSLTCLTEAALTPEDADYIDMLVRANHSQFSHQDLAIARERARIHQTKSEIAHIVLWLVWPCILMVLHSIVGAYVLARDLHLNRDLYKESLEFYREVHSKGFTHAKKKYISDVWRQLVDVYYKKILGMWWPIRHFRTFMRRGIFDLHFWWRECHGLRLITVFICFGGVIRGVLRGMRCVEMVENDVSVLYARSEVQCEALVLLPAAVGGLIWCVGYPLYIYYGLRQYNMRNSQGKRFNLSMEDWGLLVNGYKPEYWFWEVLIYFRKTMLVLTVIIPFQIWQERGRVLFFLLTAIFFGVLQVCFNPYDQRYNHLLTRVELHHICTWILIGVLLQLIQTIEFNSVVVLVPCVALILHLAFIYTTLRHIYYSSLPLISAQLDSRSSPKQTKVAGKVQRWLSQQIHRTMDTRSRAQPYIALDHLYGWVSILGWGGDETVAPQVPKGRDAGTRGIGAPRPSEELDMPYHAHANRDPREVSDQLRPTPKQWQRLLTALDEAFRYIAEKRIDSRSVFSGCTYDFLLRAAFVLHRQASRGRSSMGGTERPEEVGSVPWLHANIKHDPIELLKDPGLAAWGPVSEATAAGGPVDLQQGDPDQAQPSSDERFYEFRGQIMGDQLRRETLAILMSQSQLRQLQDKEKGQTRSEREKDEGTRSQLLRELYSNLVDEMFSFAPFRRGMTLEALEVSLLALERLPHHELLLWMDIFEGRWFRNLKSLRWEVRSLRGDFAEQVSDPHEFEIEDPDMGHVAETPLAILDMGDTNSEKPYSDAGSHFSARSDVAPWLAPEERWSHLVLRLAVSIWIIRPSALAPPTRRLAAKLHELRGEVGQTRSRRRQTEGHRKDADQQLASLDQQLAGLDDSAKTADHVAPESKRRWGAQSLPMPPPESDASSEASSTRAAAKMRSRAKVNPAAKNRTVAPLPGHGYI